LVLKSHDLLHVDGTVELLVPNQDPNNRKVVLPRIQDSERYLHSE
jgi:hypothetical protein